MKYKKGFTLAEILITLVIVGFIASLGIPMLGQQKMKKPVQVKMRHGTFECYYDQNGALHSYYADSEEKPNGISDAHLSGGSCQFTPPSESNVYIYAIGAGGAGAYGMNNNIPYYIYKPFDTEGWVSTGPDFRLSLKEACEEHPWICENWNKQWESSNAKEIEYIINSPLGYAGKNFSDHCLKNHDDQLKKEQCLEECAAWHTDCEKDCYTLYTASGGKGGMGGWYRIKVKLMAEDDVKYIQNSSKAGITFNTKKFFELLPSGNGEDGHWVDNCQIIVDGENGADYPPLPANQNSNSYMNWGKQAGSMTIDASGNLDPQEPVTTGMQAIKAGSIGGNPQPSQIKYEAKESGIRAFFGPAGGAGVTNFRVYEKLPRSSIFTLNPASNSGHSSIVKLNGEDLFEASGGYNGYFTNDVFPINKNDRIFPAKYGADDFAEHFPAFSVSHGVGYRSQLATMGLVPGKSGAGAYPVLHNVPANTEKFKINGVEVTDGLVEEVHYDLPDKCFDGSDLQNQGDQYYCGKETDGNPGAIVIKW